MGEFNAQGMANTVWAYACVGFEQRQVFGELVSAIAARLGDFDEMDMSQLDSFLCT